MCFGSEVEADCARVVLPVQGVWALASDTSENSTPFRDVKCRSIPFHIPIEADPYREPAIQKILILLDHQGFLKKDLSLKKNIPFVLLTI